MRHAFMIAASGSGVGKTTITCALLSAMKNEYAGVRAFKCGPDYIDPLFHQTVLGIESVNLDLFFTDEKATRDLFNRDNESEVSLVEGVMGLYDGINSESYEGSSYHLAAVLDIPVILLIDGHGMGRSILAMIRGYLDMDDRKIIKGVILNRVSKGYFQTIAPIIKKELGIEVYGYYPKAEELAISGRYLGLTLPEEIDDIKEKINRSAEIIKETVDIEKLINDSEYEEPSLAKESVKALSGQEDKVRIAIARDEAFCFYYKDNLRILEELGAELVPFSPIHDEKLPSDIDGIILGGGYPELHALAISENESMKTSIREQIVNNGIPSLAECGGFMYLHDSIKTDAGEFKMLGILEGSCFNAGKLVRFGYVSIEDKRKVFLASGDGIKGHEFHYYDSSDNGNDAIACKPVSLRSWECAHIGNNHWWGYAHLYYRSNPLFARKFIEECRRYKNG